MLQCSKVYPVVLAGCALLAACATADAPPARDAKTAPWATEEEVIAQTCAVYAAHGHADAASVPMDHDDAVLIPYADPRTVRVVSRRFLGARGQLQAHLAAVDATLYGGRLTAAFAALGDRGPRAYEAFMAGVYAHELAHALAVRRGVSRWASDPWGEETRAVRFEVAVLRALAESPGAPPGLLADWRAFNQVLLAAAPDGVVAALPADEPGRRAAFASGYGYAATGQFAGHEAEIAVVLALYTRYRLETLAAPPAWGALAEELPTAP